MRTILFAYQNQRRRSESAVTKLPTTPSAVNNRQSTRYTLEHNLIDERGTSAGESPEKDRASGKRGAPCTAPHPTRDPMENTRRRGIRDRGQLRPSCTPHSPVASPILIAQAHPRRRAAISTEPRLLALYETSIDASYVQTVFNAKFTRHVCAHGNADKHHPPRQRVSRRCA